MCPYRYGRACADRGTPSRPLNGGFMGISRWQSGSRRDARSGYDPRTQRGTGNQSKRRVPRPVNFCEPRLSGLSFVNGFVCMSALGRYPGAAGRPDPRLGTTEPSEGLPDAASRRTAHFTSFELDMIQKLRRFMGTEKSRVTAGHAMKKYFAPATQIRSSLANFWTDESGTTAIEYGLIAAMIVIVVVAGMQAVGDAIKTSFYDKIATIF